VRIKLWHRQLIRYGLVGIVSTTVHIVMATLLLKFAGLSLVLSNVGAFLSAVFVSYYGNALWSFQAQVEVRSIGKFVGASTITLTLIVLISNWVTQAGVSPYLGILMIAVVVPIIGFILQKIWVFGR
jgi:putative flippase GtrA